MTVRKFSAGTISDQKRLVRGEQLLLARTILRGRDEIHHRKWRVMILAGGAPQGEIGAIRELMPQAHILAVDRNQACLDAALAAGADEIVRCDLTDWDDPGSGGFKYPAATAIASRGPFDLVALDLCGGVCQTAKNIWKAYKRLITSGGVILVTFSYGRDVTEMFIERALDRDVDSKYLKNCDVPKVIADRLLYLFTTAQLDHIRSVLCYRGNEMPMCSVCYAGGERSLAALTFLQVQPGDFEIAVLCPDPAKLYDCPADRILALRRQHAAFRAAITLKRKRQRREAERKRRAKRPNHPRNSADEGTLPFDTEE